ERRHREGDLEYREPVARYLDDRVAGREAGVAEHRKADAAAGDMGMETRSPQVRLVRSQRHPYIAAQHRLL
ncbi:MAG TPA: hypothetical protein VFY87_32280, partial [Geminicoccaceae bacterium]|nr:hypothetical protein [Geminicoccaceae bacterium]